MSRHRLRLRYAGTLMPQDLNPASQLPVTLMPPCWPRVDFPEPLSLHLRMNQPYSPLSPSPFWNWHLSRKKHSRHGGSGHWGSSPYCRKRRSLPGLGRRATGSRRLRAVNIDTCSCPPNRPQMQF